MHLRGFTLVELILVVAILGIVLALVLAKTGDVRAPAYLAAMKSDLRNVVGRQEQVYLEVGAYGDTISALGIVTSADVEMFIAAGPESYLAIAIHDKTSTPCSIEVGPAAKQRIHCGRIESSWPVDHSPHPTEQPLGLEAAVFVSPSVPGKYKIVDTNCRMELIRQSDGFKESRSGGCPAEGAHIFVFPTLGVVFITNDNYRSGASGSDGTLHGITTWGVQP